MGKREKKKKKQQAASARKAQETVAPPPDLAQQVGSVADFLVLTMFCFYLVTRPMVASAGVGGQGLGTNNLMLVFIVTATLIWFLRCVLEGGFEVVFSGLEIPALIFLGLAGISAYAAADALHAWVRLSYWVGDLCCFWLALQYGRRTGARLLLRTLLGAVGVIALYGIYQRFWGFETMRAAGLEMLPMIPAEMREHWMIRVNSRRIFSTFVLANSLAGYLIALLPLTLVLALQQRGTRWRFAAWLLPAAVGVALLLSGSKGGILALGAALALGCLVRWRLILEHRRSAVIVGCLLALGLGLFCLTAYRVGPFSKLRSALGDTFPTRKVLGDTIRVRLGYWRAGYRIARDHPLRGVGPDNFASYYPGYRDAAAGQVQQAHNNYVQLAAEVGIPGLLAFCVFWALFWRRLGRKPETPLAEPARDGDGDGEAMPHAGKIYYLVGALAFAFLFAIDKSFDGPVGKDGQGNEGLAYLVALVVFVLIGLLIRPKFERLTLWAMGVGVAGFLLHSIVDFDLYVIGITSTVWTLAGLCCALIAAERGLPARTLGLPILARVLPVMLSIAPFFFFTNQWLVETYRAERHLELASGYLQARPPQPGLAMEQFGFALDAMPRDYGTHYELGRLHMTSFMRARTHRQIEAYAQSHAMADRHLAACQLYNSRHAGAPFERGLGFTHVYRIFDRDSKKIERGSALRTNLEQRAGKAQQRAIDYYAEAAQLYPTNPYYRFWHGKALIEAGRGSAGLAEYALALQYHDLREPRDSLRLRDTQAAEARQALKER